ncbi:hypothetical protein PR202_ga22062 [Eleusine coracana subsp. coracana]|uniref:Uncharacterized protein n=1 Tax=Eleusine coracana subsp. coracana TaxID=191504 RepID=A0AAV5D1L3_ELECO|nr:hypothetical protein PR202_ga22062 [Eleusine coracana subsp. coracana]
MKQFSSGLPHEYYYYYCGFCLFLGILVHAVLRTKSGGSKNPGPNLPPGPWQLPILGSFHHLLRGVPHHTMRDLSHQYGPLMMFKVCERIVVVVSTAEVAREVFKGHETAFEQRPTSPVLDELHSGHGQGVALAPYGEHWRQLRRIIVTQLMDDILQRHEERRGTGPGNGEQEQNMIDVLLRIQKADGALGGSLTPGVIKAVLMDVFGAAVDTQTISLQWAMAELVANPRVLNKAQEEIRRVLAGKERVQEEDLTDLHYLRAVIKETLRLHPPTALVPRVCLQENKKVQGYDVPHGTILVTNVWAISRDPKYWKDPDRFIPERFENEGALDFKGTDFEYIPFGAGRRICPGITFAQANLEIALVSLLYHFDWELPLGVKPEELDMTEVFGITVKRKAELLLHSIPWIPE